MNIPQQLIGTRQDTAEPSNFYVPVTPLSGGIVGSLITVICFVLWIRRRLSSDSLQMAKDTSEKRLLTIITEERDRAVLAAETAWKTRAEDAKLIGQLTSEVKHLSETNISLIRDIAGMREEIAQLRGIVQESRRTTP